MEELKELIRIVSKHKIKQIEIVGNQDIANKSLFHSLYSAVDQDIVKTDEEAIEYLYNGASGSKHSYTKLKNRLKSRLVNTLFFIDINQPQFTDLEQAFYTCSRNWMASRILMSRGARMSSINLAEKTIRVAIKYEFTELIVYLAKELQLHFSVVQADQKKYSRYRSALSQAIYTLQAEVIAEQYYTEIMQAYSLSQQSGRQEVVQRAVQYSEELESTYSNVDSFKFIRMSYLLHIVSKQISFRFDDAIAACKKATSIIKAKPYESKGAIFGFHLRELSCYVQLMKFQEGEKLAEHYKNSLSAGSYDWYVILFYYFLLCTHSGNYQKAYEVLQLAIRHPKFTSFYENHKQLWLVHEAYIHFLIHANEIDPAQSEYPNPKKFRLYKFLNEIPIYSKDKRGINISILIVHVLLLLQQRKYDKIIDRVDALNQYCHRYLRRDDTFRANCFIKMLLQMAKADFNRVRTVRYADKYLLKLKSMPIDVAQQGIEVETIPYENLWEIVLDLLG